MLSFIIKSWNELTKQELYQLLQLRSEVFVVEQECAYQDLDGQDEEAMHLLVTEPNKALLGYARIYSSSIEKEAVQAIGRVCVRESERGESIARRMMEVALEYIERHHKQAITVSAQAYLENFYQQLGFNSVSEPYLEDGIPHIRMIRDKQ
ncbi:GNAT family N-acetyltransferase [Kangiella sediminilitoris]|uniref:GCN5-related N-acetyltransferase n=1 Tax=Kangiella sediminilitoris TaxID=1144748 RepID=A0A1B3B7P4_9GAMM|nr:GNAT family N-acetyltransferase [Kangiella sediminilitoris]AOE48811.1 GCN5-related N-acetyltransferase [Kangiella sediminilitoris]